ncbi:CRISPR-associated ring nuclease [Deltaproteobacteria bacterium TL4]
MKTTQKNKNILVTTLGGTWSIIPELIGFTNPELLDLYYFHPQKQQLNSQRSKYHIQPIHEVWVVTSCGKSTKSALSKLQEWYSQGFEALKLRIWQAQGTDQLSNLDECLLLSELILTAVLHASEQSKGGQLLLSLAGGRKTMSADMQLAGMTFGCNALLHVIDNGSSETYKESNPSLFLKPIPQEHGGLFTPLVTGASERNQVLDIKDESILDVTGKNYPLDMPEGEASPLEIKLTPKLKLDLDQRLQQAKNLMVNYSSNLVGADKKTNFMALYNLHPHLIKKLQDWKFGQNPQFEKKELEWIKRLPKTELHCHLGGIADASEIIEIAKVNSSLVLPHKERLKDWLESWKKIIKTENPKTIQEHLLKNNSKPNRPFQTIRNAVQGIPEPICVTAFILLFESCPLLLDQVIYFEHIDDFHFCKIGIESYESLGDLQGSALLQTESAIRKAWKILLEKAIDHNVRYLEVRCSPVNYTRGGLDAMRVIEIGQQICAEYHHQIEVGLILIASRHGKMSTVYQHIELAQEILNTKTSSSLPLVGFDLAGNENHKKASEMRKAFLPLMKECLYLTIHAGETEDVESIWEAIYHLNASRIGHGLTLNENPLLLKHFIDRRITLEMCPSSNFQIIGFQDNYYPERKDFNEYPLKTYLKEGLKVTVNTDNPGISKTNFTKELHRAARLSPGGLNAWELLQLIRNSFRGTFLSHEQSRKLLLDAEKEIVQILRNEN